MRLIQNAIQILPSGHFVKSVHRHDFKPFYLGGETNYRFIDGGNEYRRCSDLNSPLIVDYLLTETSTIGEVCEKLLWGVRKGTHTEYLPISTLSLDHLKAIRTENYWPCLNALHQFVIEDRIQREDSKWLKILQGREQEMFVTSPQSRKEMLPSKS